MIDCGTIPAPPWVLGVTAYTFETITDAQAAAFTAGDSLTFTNPTLTAESVEVRFNPQTGGGGSDPVTGAGGNDIVDLGTGADTLNDSTGADLVTVGDGADSVLSGADNDTITAGTGNDVVTGDEGDAD